MRLLELVEIKGRNPKAIKEILDRLMEG